MTRLVTAYPIPGLPGRFYSREKHKGAPARLVPPWYRVIGDDVPRTKARLRLVEAVQVTLRQTLGLLGISAPERM